MKRINPFYVVAAICGSMALLFTLLAFAQIANAYDCVDPNMDGQTTTADALIALNQAAGIEPCEPATAHIDFHNDVDCGPGEYWLFWSGNSEVWDITPGLRDEDFRDAGTLRWGGSLYMNLGPCGVRTFTIDALGMHYPLPAGARVTFTISDLGDFRSALTIEPKPGHAHP